MDKMLSRWRIEAHDVPEIGMWDCLVWRRQKNCSEVFVGRGVGPTRFIAANRARSSAKHRCSDESWCTEFSEKCLRQTLERRLGRSWSNL